jgi:hypothetical protein
MPRTDEGTRCECSTADRKIASRQSHGLSTIGCTIPLGGGRESLEVGRITVPRTVRQCVLSLAK